METFDSICDIVEEKLGEEFNNLHMDYFTYFARKVTTNDAYGYFINVNDEEFWDIFDSVLDEQKSG